MSTRAQQIDILLAGLRDTDNNQLSGGTVYFYEAGTTTAKNVWTEKEKTNAYTSRELNSYGEVGPIYAEGIYKIVVKDSDGNTLHTWDNLKFKANNFYTRSISNDATLTTDDDFIIVDTSGGQVTVTLAPAADMEHQVVIKRNGGNDVVVDANASETIDGSATFTIDNDDMAVMFASDGSAIYKANDAVTHSTDAINLVATVGGSAKVTAKSTSVDIITNNEYLRWANNAGNGWISAWKINTSDRLETAAAITTPQFHNGSNTIDFPTNGMANAKFMLGNSNTIAWFYLNTAPPGWKVLATGADTVLGISGGSAAYNVNGGNPDSSATWARGDHTLSEAELPSHTHSCETTGAHTHSLTLYSETLAAGASGQWGTSDTTNDTNTTTSNGDHNHTIGSTGSGSAHNHGSTWRPAASVGKLFQLDTAA